MQTQPAPRRREAYWSIKAHRGTSSSNNAPSSLKTGALLDVNKAYVITHGDQVWAAPALEAVAARTEGSRHLSHMPKVVARGGALPSPPRYRCSRRASLCVPRIACSHTPSSAGRGFFDSAAFGRPLLPHSHSGTATQDATPRRLAKAPRRPVIAGAAKLEPMLVVPEVAPVSLRLLGEAARPALE